MNVFLKAISLYEEEGYEIKTAINPTHFSLSPVFLKDFHAYLPFTYILKKNNQNLELSTGGGIHITEIYFLESLASLHPNISNIYIVGNAFGFSTIILSLLFPYAKVVAIDAGIEGEDNMQGIELTNHICEKNKLNASVFYGFSPQNNKTIIDQAFPNQKLDLVFIDGLHTNKQLLLDFESIQKFCHKETIYIMHDIINWNMQDSFKKIKVSLPTHCSNILYRTQSGMGFCVPKQSKKLIFLLHAFSVSQEHIKHLEQIAKKQTGFLYRIKLLVPNPVKKVVKKLLGSRNC